MTEIGKSSPDDGIDPDAQFTNEFFALFSDVAHEAPREYPRVPFASHFVDHNPDYVPSPRVDGPELMPLPDPSPAYQQPALPLSPVFIPGQRRPRN